ncbi:hypothetical protein BV25DRAFT_1872574 [Artomyces pyxidatus]|uniref:Uncharacterized protein n=1 Tax=Artomyces pyxidatus TaxID=48021 RepID=A0ACB8SKQ6_9AGAM|nr:hypothetical protein BV25DRAFT_1872574 [Artomyces pyxidatus]
MDQFKSFDAILFPADGRPPCVVPLMTSPALFITPHSPQPNQARIPHPELYMEYIAANVERAWQHQCVEALDCMNKKFTNPYIVYFPVISHDGLPFPVNKIVKEMQGRMFVENCAWRGDLIVAKYSDGRFLYMKNASMADFPILKNYFSTHSPLIQAGTLVSTVTSAVVPSP